MGTGRRCPVHGTPEQVAVELYQNRDAELSRFRARVAELEAALKGYQSLPLARKFDHCGAMNATQLEERDIYYLRVTAKALSALASRSGLVTVERDRLREIEWAGEAAEASGREGEHFCVVCGAYEKDGHAPGCWLGAACEALEGHD